MKGNGIKGPLQEERWLSHGESKNDGGFKFQISCDFAAHDVMLHKEKFH
jgi:hypothetical protein